MCVYIYIYINNNDNNNDTNNDNNTKINNNNDDNHNFITFSNSHTNHTGVHMVRFRLGSILIGLASNWARF